MKFLEKFEFNIFTTDFHQFYQRFSFFFFIVIQKQKTKYLKFLQLFFVEILSSNLNEIIYLKINNGGNYFFIKKTLFVEN